MLTLEEKNKLNDSAFEHWRAVARKTMEKSHTYIELMNYQQRDIPARIYTICSKEMNKLNRDRQKLNTLERALLRLKESIKARPCLYKGDDGFMCVLPGGLPSGECSSTDEAQALAMLTAYRANAAFQVPCEEELPF